MKKTVITLFVLLNALYFNAAQAGSVTSALVTKIDYRDDGSVLITTDGTHASKPACATSALAQFVINASTTPYKNMLAGLMLAKAEGKPVTIMGANDCSLWSTIERIDYVSAE